MPGISTTDLFVVIFPHTDGYSFDTSPPDEVFLTKDEAKIHADELNKDLAKSPPGIFRSDKRYYVETLADRLETIRDECRREGERNAANNG